LVHFTRWAASRQEPYQLRCADTDRGEYVYAETADDLLADWIPG
jgi:hypothetical protein